MLNIETLRNTIALENILGFENTFEKHHFVESCIQNDATQNIVLQDNGLVMNNMSLEVVIEYYFVGLNSDKQWAKYAKYCSNISN